MYLRQRYTVDEYAIPLSEDPMPMDVLLGLVGEVAEFCDQYAVPIENRKTAHWSIRSWPGDRDPEHLVIWIRTETGHIGVTQR